MDISPTSSFFVRAIDVVIIDDAAAMCVAPQLHDESLS